MKSWELPDDDPPWMRALHDALAGLIVIGFAVLFIIWIYKLPGPDAPAPHIARWHFQVVHGIVQWVWG
jgi:hypothetical protein